MDDVNDTEASSRERKEKKKFTFRSFVRQVLPEGGLSADLSQVS